MIHPRFIAGLEDALAQGGGTHDLADVLQQLEDNEAQLWESENAVIVTEIHLTPRMRVLHFWLATGDLEEVIQLSNVALDWGVSKGCSMATLSGRRGWERVLASEGWKPRLSLMSRTLGGT